MWKFVLFLAVLANALAFVTLVMIFASCLDSTCTMNVLFSMASK